MSDPGLSWPHEFGWAFNAYDRFMAELSEGVRSRLFRGDTGGEAHVVVFGETQVGKTTLILDLMGVAAHCQARVSAVLRGGREAGSSATATAMYYKRSRDGAWRLLSPGEAAEELLSDEAMEEALGRLRERVIGGRLAAGSPHTVEIPSAYFDDAGGFDVAILDLPGEHSREPGEQQHVHALATRYVPAADLILLVGRADRLGFLQPSHLTLPGIEDWQLVPNRFRVVLTFAYQPKTMIDFVRASGCALDIDDVRRHLIAELEKFGPLLKDARQLHRFYPLEFGRSWHGDDGRADIKPMLGKMIAELKDELLADIRRSATRLGRLRGAVDARVVVQRVRADRHCRMEKEREELEARVRKEEEERREADLQAEEAKSRLREREQKVRFLENELEALSAPSCLTVVSGASDPVGFVEPSVQAFRTRIAEIQQEFRKLAAEWRPGGYGSSRWRAVKPPFAGGSADLTAIVRPHFAALERKLDGYALDWYRSSGANYAADKSALRKAYENSLTAVMAYVWSKWKRSILSAIAARRADVEKARIVQQLTELSSITIRRAYQQAASDLAAHTEQMEHFEAQMERDDIASGRFLALLEEEYAAESERRLVGFVESYDTVDAFYKLFAAVQLPYERQKVMQGL